MTLSRLPQQWNPIVQARCSSGRTSGRHVRVRGCVALRRPARREWPDPHTSADRRGRGRRRRSLKCRLQLVVWHAAESSAGAPVDRTAAVVGTAAVVAHGVNRRSDRRDDRRDHRQTSADACASEERSRSCGHFEEDAMSQSHLVIDFPIKDPADAKALRDELPPLMPDFARLQDDFGTVHFSRFMVEGNEKASLPLGHRRRGRRAHRAARGPRRPGVRRHLRIRRRSSRHARGLRTRRASSNG